MVSWMAAATAATAAPARPTPPPQPGDPPVSTPPLRPPLGAELKSDVVKVLNSAGFCVFNREVFNEQRADATFSYLHAQASWRGAVRRGEQRGLRPLVRHRWAVSLYVGGMPLRVQGEPHQEGTGMGCRRCHSSARAAAARSFPDAG